MNTNENTPTFDIDAYFKRIRYTGDRSPTMQTLRAIQVKHTENIPFENLNPLLRLPVKLDIASLQQKIVNEQRGGYCFEQNILVSHVLKVLGFEVRWLAARVLWNRPEGVINPRTHMLLFVKIDGEPYVADVGFGGLTLTAPLRLIPDIEQPTPHETFRLIQKEEQYVLEANVREEWKPLYDFTLEEQLLPDFEVMSFFLCHHHDSHFIKMLRVARAAPGYRYALMNNEFAVHEVNGATERKTLSTVDEVLATLENSFLIRLPDTPELKETVEKVIATIAQ